MGKGLKCRVVLIRGCFGELVFTTTLLWLNFFGEPSVKTLGSPLSGEFFKALPERKNENINKLKKINLN